MDETLLAVQVVFRHGDRTPLGTYANDPHQEAMAKMGLCGELTNQGKQNQYKLGQWLRQRYDAILPRKYSPHDVTVVSNDVDRCLMSASCNLCGLYPPIDNDDVWNESIQWQPIPVHIDTVLMDPLPGRDKLLLIPGVEPFIRERMDKYKPLLNYLTEHSGQTVKSLWEAILFRDIFTIQQLNGLPLPEWSKTVFPQQLNDITSDFFSIGGTVKEMGRYAVGPMLKSIVDYFQSVDKKKLVMYSGHDFTISTLISLLTPQYEKFTPEFSSCLLFELLVDNNSQQQHVKCLLKRNDQLQELFDLPWLEFEQLLTPFMATLEEKQRMFGNLLGKDGKGGLASKAEEMGLGALDRITKSSDHRTI